MKRLVLFISLLFVFPLILRSQSIILHDDGSIYESNFSSYTEHLLFAYRNIYGHYPSNKREFLRFIHNDWHCHKKFNKQFPKDQYQSIAKEYRHIRNKKNVLYGSEDTCYFYLRNYHCTVRINGGAEDYITQNYDFFRSSIISSCFDQKGRYLYSIQLSIPSIDSTIRWKYKGIIAIDVPPHEMLTRKSLRLAFMKVTVNRLGEMHYDISHLRNHNLVLCENKKEIVELRNDVQLDSLIDYDYLHDLQILIRDFMERNTIVDTMQTWELILLNPHDTL